MINWKLRLKNRATLATLIGTAVAFIYQVLGVLGVVPSISETDIINWVGIVLNVLVGLGVIIDPTTSGISDSPRALDYDAPSTDDGDLSDYDDDEGDEIDLDELLTILAEDDEDDEFDDLEDPDDDEELPQ